MKYSVEVVDTSLIFGSTSAKEIEKVLNRKAGAGWTLKTALKSERHSFFGGRDATFLIFEMPDDAGGVGAKK